MAKILKVSTFVHSICKLLFERTKFITYRKRKTTVSKKHASLHANEEKSLYPKTQLNELTTNGCCYDKRMQEIN